MTSRFHREFSVGFVGAVLALSLISGACNGGSSRGSPTSPPEVVEVAGQWGGVTSIESVSGCGCVGQEFGSFGPINKDTEWEISQSGAAIEGSFYDDWGPGWCDFTGTIDVNDFRAASTGCEQEEMQWGCENGNPRSLVLRNTDWQGRVHLGTSHINGTAGTTWDCFDSRNGQAMGALTLQFSFRLFGEATEDQGGAPGTVAP